jgi:3-oxoacid CoA-transferase subunit B
VIVTMEHTAKSGAPKILKQCRLPLTGSGVVDTIVTELGFMRVTPQGLVLEEIAPAVTIEYIQSVTEATLIPSATLKVMES